MPLIMLCGIPASGKSTRAKQLHDHLVSQGRTVHIVSEDSLLIDRNEGYKDSVSEKQTRGKIKATCDRFLTKDVIVVADSLNYIKGFRYEMFCSARAARTPHCVLFCDTPVEKAKEWNAQKPEKERWSEKMLTELSMRMEIPNGNNRWDNPLFTVLPNDPTPIEEITRFVTCGKAATPTLATMPQRLSDTNFFYELDQITNEIVNEIVAAQTTAMPGDLIPVPKTTEKISFSPCVASF
eukprot:GEZU01021687.1.p1 GENE.GEZU01021687.1~~GEZU01021687.1.p1  ORF type:complete len:248 (-),score=17.02 GEZU01021687.1:74-787(-)